MLFPPKKLNIHLAILYIIMTRSASVIQPFPAAWLLSLQYKQINDESLFEILRFVK